MTNKTMKPSSEALRLCRVFMNDKAERNTNSYVPFYLLEQILIALENEQSAKEACEVCHGTGVYENSKDQECICQQCQPNKPKDNGEVDELAMHIKHWLEGPRAINVIRCQVLANYLIDRGYRKAGGLNG